MIPSVCFLFIVHVSLPLLKEALPVNIDKNGYYCLELLRWLRIRGFVKVETKPN